MLFSKARFLYILPQKFEVDGKAMRFHLPPVQFVSFVNPLHSKSIRFHRRYLVAQIPVHNVSNYRANLSPPCQLNSSVHLVHKTSFLNEKIQKFFCQEFLHNNNKRCYLLRDDVVVTKQTIPSPSEWIKYELIAKWTWHIQS